MRTGDFNRFVLAIPSSRRSALGLCKDPEYFAADTAGPLSRTEIVDPLYGMMIAGSVRVLVSIAVTKRNEASTEFRIHAERPGSECRPKGDTARSSRTFSSDRVERGGIHIFKIHDSLPPPLPWRVIMLLRKRVSHRVDFSTTPPPVRINLTPGSFCLQENFPRQDMLPSSTTIPGRNRQIGAGKARV